VPRHGTGLAASRGGGAFVLVALPPLVARSSNGAIRKGTALKVTIDSTEPLADVLRVIGAVYGVNLVVADNRTDESAATPQRTTTPRKRTPGGKNARTGADSSNAGKRRPPRARAGRSADAPSNAEVRSWARANGFTVSGRGRVPASVMTAFRNAQH
jgi:hypothetical protein